MIDPAVPGAALQRIRIPTESDRGYDHVVGRIRALVQRLVEESGLPLPPVVGIGTPGTADPSTGLMKNCNTRCLNGRPLPTDLASALGCTVRVINDADAFALAEATLGAGRGYDVVLGLILGTGVGGGIVVRGRALQGRHGIAGEWGHNPIAGERGPCYCGRRGCVETVIAGPALERFYAGQGGSPARLSEIAERAEDGEPAARDTLGRLVEKFGEALAAVLNILDPDAVIIGGGVGNLDVLYGQATRDAVRRHLFNPELRTDILRPALGDSAGVYGAALLAGT